MPLLVRSLHPTPNPKLASGSIRKETLLFLVSCFPVALLFFGLASIRQAYLDVLQTNSFMENSSFYLVGINLFAYLITYLLVREYKPNKKEIEAIQTHNQKEAAYKELLAEQNATSTEIQKIKTDLDDRLSQRHNVLILAKQNEAFVNEEYLKCMSQLQNELVLLTSGEFLKYPQLSFAPLKLKYQQIESPIEQLGNRQQSDTTSSKFSSILWIIGICTSVLMGCQKQGPKRLSFTYLKDVTSECYRPIDSLHLEHFLSDLLDKEICSDIHFTITPISDSKYPPPFKALFKCNRGILSSNLIEEKHHRQVFVHEALRLTKKVNAREPGHNQSLIFYQIRKSAVDAINLKADQLILIVDSDLMENSSAFSCYDSDFTRLSPKAIRSKLNLAYPLPIIPKAAPLDIQVYVLHSETSEHSDQVFEKMLQVFDSYIEQIGGSTHVINSLNQIN
jgi:hypothetical protein